MIVTGAPNVIVGKIGSPSPSVGGAGGVMAGLVAATGIDAAVRSVYSVENAIVKKLAQFGAHHLAGNKKLQTWLAARPSSGAQKFFDGRMVWAGCSPSDPSTAATAKGLRRRKCADPGKTIPKV